LIEINLLPTEFRKKETRKMKLPPLPTMRYFIIALCGLALLELLVFGLNWYKKTELAHLNESYERIRPELEEIDKLRDETSFIQKRLKNLRRLTTRPFYWTQLLNIISDEITEGVWLTEINIRESRIQSNESRKGKRRRNKQESGDVRIEKSIAIRGFSNSKVGGTAAVTKFIQRLEEHAVFQKPFSRIWLEKIGRQKRGVNQLFDFTIVCLFEDDIAQRK